MKLAKLVSTLKEYSALTKLKLSLLNTTVTAAVYLSAQGSLQTLPLLMFSTQFFAMSSQVFNQVLQCHLDKQMQRTRLRPLVTGTVSLIKAKFIGSLFLFGGIAMSLYINPKTFVLSFCTWLCYLTLYTKLKTRSQANTIIGAFIGSATVYIGWAASNQSLCMCEPLALFSYMVFWQLQHFYAIRWMHSEDYQRVFKMENNKSLASFYINLSLLISAILMNYSLMHCYQNPYYILNLIFNGSIYKYGFKSIRLLEEGKASLMKKHSYIHFINVFLIIAFITVRKQFSDRKISARRMPPKNQTTANQSGLLSI